MDLTPEQQARLARLYENESLTDNLTDTDAKAVLEWAQRKILGGAAEADLVTAAVSAANQSGEEGAAALLLQADDFLAQEIKARTMDSAQPNQPHLSTLDADAGAAREQTAEASSEKLDTASSSATTPTPLQVTGEAGTEQLLLEAHADAMIAPQTRSRVRAKKSRAKAKRRKK